MRKNIETPYLASEVIKKLQAIVDQKPQATVSLCNEFGYGFLLDDIIYDADENIAMFELIENY